MRPLALQLIVPINVELLGADLSVFVLIVLPKDVVHDLLVEGLVALLALFLLVLLLQVFLNLGHREQTDELKTHFDSGDDTLGR